MANNQNDVVESDQQQSSNQQTYGVPIYAVEWIPEETARSQFSKKDQDGNSEDGESSSSSSSRSYIVLSGGGGEGRSGIPNVILICQVDRDSNSLSEQPLGKLGLGTYLPYRMAVHPRGDGLICALPNSCRLFDWETIMMNNNNLEEQVVVIKELKDVGQQLALAFNHEGTVLAVGGEDGTLRVFEWPGMKTLLNESKAHSPDVKSLTFSESGKFFVSLGGPICRVWEVNASAAATVATLSKDKDERLASCRFSVDNAGDEVLYIAANTDRGGSIITWDTTTWKRKKPSKLFIKKNSICAFNVSPDGKLLAIGTPEGDVLIIDSTSMKTRQVVNKAHLGLVTALTFSPDSRCLVSVSFDSRARLTVIEQKGVKSTFNYVSGGISLLLVLVALLLLFVSYYMEAIMVMLNPSS